MYTRQNLEWDKHILSYYEYLHPQLLIPSLSSLLQHLFFNRGLNFLEPRQQCRSRKTKEKKRSDKLGFPGNDALVSYLLLSWHVYGALSITDGVTAIKPLTSHCTDKERERFYE